LPGADTSSLATLSQLSAALNQPLGVGWDVDYIQLEITPAAIPIFSQYWNLGGSSSRGPHNPFPEGLELCTTAPFTLRAVVDCEDKDTALAAFGKDLIDVLHQISPTCQPTLIQPSTLTSAAKALAREPRMVGGIDLAKALQHPR
jgi:hypothetical protein